MNQITDERKPLTSRTPWTCFICGKSEPDATGDMAPTWDRSPAKRGKCHKACMEAEQSVRQPVPVTVPTVNPNPLPATPATNEAGALLAAIIGPYLSEKITAALDENQVRDIAEALVDERVEMATTAIIARLKRELERIEVLEVRRHETPAIRFTLYHPTLKRATYWASKHKHVYLYGPRGSGKSEMARQIAEALGVPFYTLQLNQQTSESKLSGLRDAMGNTHSTPFIEAYRNGGLFYLSEADNASGNFLTGLNTALANGYFTTAWGETITMHANFYFVADGNTAGFGHDAMYSSRGKLDGATRDRWVVVVVAYDETLERKLAMARNALAGPWVDWIQSARKFVLANSLDVAATPRAAITGAEALLDDELTVDEIADDTVFKGMQVVDPAVKAKVLANCPYSPALLKMGRK